MVKVVLESIFKRFESVEVIRGIDLTIEDGEFVVFVGPSGCGKSTLLRMIAGLEEISSGRLIIDGEEVNHVPAAERGLAMVFQSYALYPHMTAYKNMAFGLETAKLPRAEIDGRVHEAARILRIEELLSRKPRQLSGGQRQRVAIGRAIVREPRIFLFDEPLSNLDADLRVQMRVELTKLYRSLKATVIYVTHDQVEAMTMATKIVVLNGGRIEQVGSPLDIYNKPANLFVAGFVGSPRMNFINARIVGATPDDTVIEVAGRNGIRVGPIAAVMESGSSVTLGIRPEHLSISGNAAGLEAKVTLTEQLGDETLVYLSLSDGQNVVLQVPGQRLLENGQVIHLDIPASSAHLFDAAGAAIR
ncbi:MAG: ABC transporter ATP-binding protein [Parvibaculaceae bacterium]